MPAPTDPNAPIPPGLLPPNIAAQLPNLNAPPLSMQLGGLNSPSQVVMNMLQSQYGANPLPPSDPQEVAGFWQGIGRQGSTAQNVTPKKRRDVNTAGEVGDLSSGGY